MTPTKTLLSRPPRLDVVVMVGMLSGLLSFSAHAQPQPSPPDVTSPAVVDGPAATTPAAAEETLSPDQRFKRGKNLFDYRDCTGTIAVLAELAIPGQLADEHEQAEVHRMLGVCHALVDTPEHKREAAREFSSLLSIDPDYQLDPFEVPPPVVELFETQKQAMKVRLDEIRKAHERAKEDNFDDGGVLVERTTSVRVTPVSVAFVPFGLSQVANGEIVKGAVFGAIQGVGLMMNIMGFWDSLAVQNGVGDGFTKEEVDLEAPLWVGHLIGLGLFTVGYGVSVTDALWNREDQMVLAEKQTKRPLTSSELKKLKRIERAPDPPRGPADLASPAPAQP